MTLREGSGDHEVFTATSALWEVRADGVVNVRFGPNRDQDEEVIAEAEWFEDHFRSLKERFPKKTWTALIDLSKVPLEHRPPRKASEVYMHILRDEQLVKIAFVHASVIHKAIVAILFAPVILSDRVHFFSQENAALDWLQSAHPHGTSINW